MLCSPTSNFENCAPTINDFRDGGVECYIAKRFCALWYHQHLAFVTRPDVTSKSDSSVRRTLAVPVIKSPKQRSGRGSLVVLPVFRSNFYNDMALIKCIREKPRVVKF